MRAHTPAYTQSHKYFENPVTICVRQKKGFILAGWWPDEKQLCWAGLVGIFANNTVISPRRAKHASVCLLIPHKRTAQSLSLIHKQRQTFPLLCRLLSFSSFYFPPSSLSPGRAHSYTHPGTSLEVYRPHTEQHEDLSLTLFLLPFLSHFHFHFFFYFLFLNMVLYHSLFFIVFSFSTSCLLSAWP